ncbi:MULTISPECIES: flagellar hook assembly protein FlgD [unclassified Nitratiruptor]|uniref:flagellar hook assembly protein FlgD n=1 Tax=unclassified Nitratiruptor TaxID=2624044 RepID=UPI00191543C2|nr:MULTISPECIES: FLgD tudor-like domain-containing protein [unclassified Nitratiruptor]BCD59927.1 flagellar basal-body rod modification protein FlgD [Nitratiruptor sp. YY08-10]BCD63850.1 flagellar basal-body rod modification protein FlgD [Nitratiruptor sp. YY08-14]
MALEPIQTIQGYAGKEINVYDKNVDQSKMDKEGFLKVLLANFQFQDPFEAQDIAKFIDNTVKLRELEVLNNFETSVNTLANGTERLLSAANLIGKKVVYTGNETFVENGKTDVSVKLDEDVNYLALYLYDENGNVVYQKELTETIPAGTSKRFEINDESIPDGVYNVGVVAKNGEEEISQVEIHSTGLVDGVEKEGSEIVLSVNSGQSVKLNDVYSIGG